MPGCFGGNRDLTFDLEDSPMLNLKRLWILISAMTLLLILVCTLPQSTAERRGEDSNPPGEGKWIINSKGNYIANETLWVEYPVDDPEDLTFFDESVKVNGSVVIRDGGSLTLFNTTINMTDHEGFTFTIEKGGELIMTNLSAVMNNNGSLIGSVEINGKLEVRNGYIGHALNIFANSSDAQLSLNDCMLSTNRSVYLRNQNLTMNETIIESNLDTPLIVSNSTLDWNGGSAYTLSNSTWAPILDIRDSSVNLSGVSVSTYSVNNTIVVLSNSTFNAYNRTSLGAGARGIPIQAHDSIITLTDLRRFSTHGDTLMECTDSEVHIFDINIGYMTPRVKLYIPGFNFDGCDVTFDNVSFFRIRGTVLTAVDSYLTIRDSVFWNSTSTALELTDSDLTIDSTAFYNIRGDAINLEDGTAQLTDLIFDEDDRNFTNGLPYPPIYSGYGYGIYGHPITIRDSHAVIINCSFSAHEMDAIHLLNTPFIIEDCEFRSAGDNGIAIVHGIWLDNSKGPILNNTFYTPYRGGGFDVYAQTLVPMDMDRFMGGNNFSDGRIIHQRFTLNVKVTDDKGDGIDHVEVNLTNNGGEGRKITETITGGWIRSPFNVPAFEIFKDDDGRDSGQGRGDEFSNYSYNDYQLILTKEYSGYNFSIIGNTWVTIDRSGDLIVIFDVSTPDLVVKGAGGYPMVLRMSPLEMSVIIMNHAEGEAEDVDIGIYYSDVDSEEWTRLGSVSTDVPGIFDGGDHHLVSITLPADMARGVYSMQVRIDPEDLIPERHEDNNNHTIPETFEVFTLPRARITHPLESEIISGTLLVGGYVADDYGNDLDIELRIDGTIVTVVDYSKQSDGVYWNFSWDTTGYDDALGRDSFPNGPHILSTRSRNSNPNGLDISDWSNSTVIVANAPELAFKNPQDGEFINITEGVPLYRVEVQVLDFRDLSNVKLRIDGGPYRYMSPFGSTYRYNLDISKFSDGPHSMECIGVWGYGNESDTLSFLLNSPSDETLPLIFADHEVTDDGLTVSGTAWDDYMITQVKVRLDNESWIIVDDSGGNTSEFEYFWPLELLTPDTHNVTIEASDGFDSWNIVLWFQVQFFYDLTLLDITLPSYVLEGDWINFTVEARNTGPYASPPVDLNLYIGHLMRTIHNISIPSNSDLPIQVSWRAKPGNHSISAGINPSQKNYERDPTNNLYLDGGILYVDALEIETPEDDSESNMRTYVAIIAIILGGAAGVAYFGTSRFRSEEQPAGRHGRRSSSSTKREFASEDYEDKDEDDYGESDSGDDEDYRDYDSDDDEEDYRDYDSEDDDEEDYCD